MVKRRDALKVLKENGWWFDRHGIIMIFIPTVIIQNQFLATVILTKSLGKRL